MISPFTSERQEKKTAIRYLRGELKERLDCLNGETDNLCKAYQAIIESMQHQLETRDIVKETHNFLDNEKIGFGTLIRAFNFFSCLSDCVKHFSILISPFMFAKYFHI